MDTGEDHAYDMLRYLLMENPIAPPQSAEQREGVGGSAELILKARTKNKMGK